MSKSNAIKTFRDLLSFLTIIPLAQTEEFVFTSARNMYLFPLMGALIGGFGALYFFAAGFVVSNVFGLASSWVGFPSGWLLQASVSALLAVMTLAFLLVFTGFQHFDGLVDLGNAVGLKRVEDRREIAHRWVVTYKGAFLAMFVEFSAFAGLFLLNWNVALRALVVAEVAAKAAMVTIVWRGKPAHAGLGSRFIGNAKRNLNVAAYASGFVLSYLLLGLAGLIVMTAAVLFGLFMEKVGNRVFGGVSGDMIGATNEGARALSLVLVAAVSWLVSALLWGALWL
jgi:adenosylcobinamide-GDP ribazoletransferase